MKRVGVISVLGAVVRRDLTIALRQKSEVLTTLFFFIIVASLFPLGIGPEAALLRRIAPHPTGGPKARQIWALTPKTSRPANCTAARWR